MAAALHCDKVLGGCSRLIKVKAGVERDCEIISAVQYQLTQAGVDGPRITDSRCHEDYAFDARILILLVVSE